ncbi:MAG: hypothetical protein COT91_02025 [Candidatus Doudnabacteria bacterium CG10_big_fil_rev_8_21_14_0_10_41_10]|uniref:AcrB/AcrD/AcrF family protein n=1 Tax=Candidatus Doudnabacteria bacterium CG10_big_fil_rev_8_21_14_0_10_41_10 TaxID=1974551 RepID=A0A2H0VDY7_9BACT|nr:MAG: hypothetical protein COT91_02025 [Candidatus Doudnabacteria bacterium CG10_big_fil_rev_8_21_14_0_10_41_10]
MQEQNNNQNITPPSEGEINRKKIEDGSKNPLSFFIRRSRLTVLIVVGIAIWGAVAGLSLPQEANPEVKIPFGVVTTVFPGASPTDVEELVTNKIEKKVENLDKVKLITSESSLSFSSVFVEFEASADLDKSIQDLKDAVSEVRGLPNEAEDPEAMGINFNDFPVVTFSVVGDLTDIELKNLGETIQKELESISGVSNVSVTGIREREISVKVNPGELERLGISINQVVGAMQAANISLPLGDVEVGELSYNVTSSGKFNSVEDLNNVVVKSSPAGSVFLSDVAKISDGLREAKSISRVSLDGGQPKPAISLQIFKRTGGNIIEIVDAAKEKIENLETEGVIPVTAQVEVTNDVSQFIRQDFTTLRNSGLQTIVIIFILLTLALSFRKAVTAILSIPLVFMMALGILSLTGSTLNSLVLFSLVLSMGLLVDTIIVLLEGIHDGLKQGFSPSEASIYSLQTYIWPVLAGVLTTISAFIPMFLVSGIMGEFLKTLPITIAATLGSSLFVGLVIMPGIAALLLRTGRKVDVEKDTIFEKYLIHRTEALYSRFITRIIASRSLKRRFVGVLAGLFVVAVGLVALGIIPIQLFPVIDVDYFTVNIELLTGSPLESSNKITIEVENQILELSEVKNFVTNIGVVLNTGEGGVGGSNENTAQIVVNLTVLNERDRKSFDIAADLREKFEGIAGATITVSELTAGPPTGAPVEIRITGNDFIDIDTAAGQVVGLLEEIDGVINIESDSKLSPPEFSFELVHDNMGRYGLTAASVATGLRAAVEGVTATNITLDGDDIDVVVTFSGSKISSVEELKNLGIVSPSGQVVKLDQIARFEISPSLEVVRHRNLDRVVNIRGDVEGTSSSVVKKVFEEKIAEVNLPKNVSAQFGGEVEDIQQSFTELWYSMIVAVILILFIMTVQFDSFKQPFIIILTLPLAVIGVVFGTFILGLEFGFATFLGVVALSGIVVNDAIILIDRINYNLKTRKLKISESIVEAGNARLEPIIMTTLTTIAGVTPLAFADAFWRGLSVAVAFGIAFATVLTMVLVPILYLKFEGKAWMKKRVSGEI